MSEIPVLVEDVKWSNDGLFDSRPPYTVRSMAERESIPRNGLTAVSTFSGCGGSSLGLKTAGYTIPYAVEFTDQGKASYEANAPETFVDQRDIRQIQASEILDRIGLNPGELDLFEGSPPCSSFSSAGVARSGGLAVTRGKVKNYSGGIHQATDDLFLEWVRLVEGLRPRTILAENVPDMLKGGEPQKFTHEIVGLLNDLGYRMHVKVYASASAGCATMRRRLIFMGVRRDVNEVPRPRLTGHGHTLREALDALPVALPADELAHSWADGTGVHDVTGEPLPNCEYHDAPECLRIRNGEPAPHAKINGRCAYSVAPLWESLERGTFHKPRITLGRASWDKPCPTFTAVGANPGTATIMHPDECRHFTPTEVKWLSGFPLDFILTGSSSDRYERIARAVTPPLYEALSPYLANAVLTGGV